MGIGVKRLREVLRLVASGGLDVDAAAEEIRRLEDPDRRTLRDAIASLRGESFDKALSRLCHGIESR